MATIDELVVKLGFEVDEKGLHKLQSLENVTGKVGDGAKDMGGGFDDAGKSMSKTLKSSDKLADSFKRVALSAFGAVSAGAAMKFALNAGDDAKELKFMADGLDMNASELRLWGSAMKNAGMDAKSFYGDLQKLRDQYGSVSLDDVLQDADQLKQLHERTGSMAEVLAQANTWGYSEDSARFMIQGAAGILDALEDARQKGQEVSQDVIDANSKMKTSYESLWETINSVGEKVVANFSPALIGVADGINAAVAGNQATFENWGRSIETTIRSIVAGFQNSVDSIAKSTEKLRQPDEQARIAALTPEEADAEREKRTAAMRNEGAVSGARTLANIVTDPLNAGMHLREGQARTKALQERENAWEGARPTGFKYGEPKGVLENLSRFLLGEQRPREVELQRREKTRQEIEELTRRPVMPSPRLAGDFDPVEFQRQAYERYREREGDLPGANETRDAWNIPQPNVSIPAPPQLELPAKPDIAIPESARWGFQMQPDISASRLPQSGTPTLPDYQFDNKTLAALSAMARLAPDIKAMMGEVQIEKELYVGDSDTLDFLRGALSYRMAPDRRPEQSHDDDASGGARGGITIERQENHFSIQANEGMSMPQLARLTASELYSAGTFGEFGTRGG